MRTLTGRLALTLVLAAGCAANDPADDGRAGPEVVSDVPDVELAVTGIGSPFRPFPTHSIPATASDVDASPATPHAASPIGASPAVETTGEPWLAGVAWATTVSDADTGSRLETIAERVPSDDARPPLALQVVAERPSRPHDHTHPGTE